MNNENDTLSGTSNNLNESTDIAVQNFENIANSPCIARREYNENTIHRHYLGSMNLSCTYCGAFYFQQEATEKENIFTKCCMHGKYVFDFNFQLLDLIQKLVEN